MGVITSKLGVYLLTQRLLHPVQTVCSVRAGRMVGGIICADRTEERPIYRRRGVKCSATHCTRQNPPLQRGQNADTSCWGVAWLSTEKIDK